MILDGRVVRLKPREPKATWNHGTRYGYGVKRCRCEACTKANRDGCRQYRHRAAAQRRRGDLA